MIASRTMVREAESLRAVDLPRLAGRVDRPALLLLGSDSPAWSQQNTEHVLAAMPSARLALLDGQGHEAVDTDPALVADLLQRHLVQAGP